jgi:hypothetical protein
MTEQTGAALGQPPIFPVGPERGNLAAKKSGADADGGVVTSDGVAADEPKQLAAQIWKCKSVRLDSDEQNGAFGNSFEQLREPGIVKVM